MSLNKLRINQYLPRFIQNPIRTVLLFLHHYKTIFLSALLSLSLLIFPLLVCPEWVVLSGAFPFNVVDSFAHNGQQAWDTEEAESCHCY